MGVPLPYSAIVGLKCGRAGTYIWTCVPEGGPYDPRDGWAAVPCRGAKRRHMRLQIAILADVVVVDLRVERGS